MAALDSQTHLEQNTTPAAAAVLRSEMPVVFLPRDEVTLADIVLILWRRWVWLLVGLIGVWCVTAGWLWRTPTLYESRGVVRIGRTRSSFPIKPTKEQQDMLLEPVPVAALRVREQYSPGSPFSQQYGGAFVSQTPFDKEADELLTILARGPAPQVTQEFLDAVLADFVREHGELFKPERDIIDRRLQEVAAHLSSLQGDLKRLEGTPPAAAGELNQDGQSPSPDPERRALHLLVRSELLRQKLSLEQEVVQLRRERVDLQSQSTRLLTPASLPVRPVEPRYVTFSVLGTAIGLCLGISLALAVEFLASVQQVLRRTRGTTSRP